MLQAFYKPGILQKVIKNEEVYRISVYISIYRELEIFQYKKVNKWEVLPEWWEGNCKKRGMGVR